MPLPHAIARKAGGALFGPLAGLFDGRPLHPTGIAFRGEITLSGDELVRGTVLEAAGTRAVTARFSRGFGIPEPLPEILSLALKLHGVREQDVLLTGSGRRPFARHVFVGGRDHLGIHYTSILPFAAGDRKVVLGVEPEGSARSFDDLRRLAAGDGIRARLRVAEPMGAWHEVGRLVLRGAPLGESESKALAFTTDRDAGGIRPVGVLNAARGGAYAAAQRVRPRR